MIDRISLRIVVIVLFFSMIGCDKKVKDDGEGANGRNEGQIISDDATNVLVQQEEKIFEFNSLKCEENVKECAKVRVKYPIVKIEGHENWEKLINEQIEDMVTSTLLYKEDVIDMYSGAQSFIEQHQMFLKESKVTGEVVDTWYNRSDISIIYQENGFISLKIEACVKEANVQERRTKDIQTINLKEGALILLEDIVLDQEKLTTLVEEKFRAFHNLDQKADLVAHGFWLEDGFELTNNVAITKEGIRIIYNASEVGPLEKGITDLLLSKNELKGLIEWPN